MSERSGFTRRADLPEEQLNDKITRRLVAGDKAMIVWWTMKAGAHVAAHSHDHEQIACMATGRMEFRLGDERRTCGPGDIVVIPAGVEHEAFFPEDTEVADVFAPPRADFLAGGTPAYVAKK